MVDANIRGYARPQVWSAAARFRPEEETPLLRPDVLKRGLRGRNRSYVFSVGPGKRCSGEEVQSYDFDLRGRMCCG